MALVIKMLLGDKTPTLYTFYNKLYDFDDLQREADLGLNDYLGTLKRGSKDEMEFRKAYLDIMLGIKDGTITFSDGRYVDSTGRRSNSPGKNKSKDYYGLMANYIYNKQGRSKEYIKPSTNPKWEGASSAGKWITNELLGPRPNFNYFVELDSYDENTGLRGIDKRSAAMIAAMKKLYNGLYVDNTILFDNLSDTDKASYKTILEEAIRNAELNGIGKDDYLSFSKAFGDLGYDKWFSILKQANKEEQPSQQVSLRDLFAKWASEHYPIPTRTLNRFLVTTGADGKPYGDQSDSDIRLWVNLASDNALNDVLASILYDPNFRFNDILTYGTGKNYNISNSTALNYILNSLNNRGLLKQNGKAYFYKFPRNANGVSLKWDGNSLLEISDWDNPFQVETMINEYNSSLGGDYSPYFAVYDRLTSHKLGGVIKAQTGIKLSNNANWYSGVFAPLLSHILEGLDANKDYYTWLNDMQDRHSELYRAAGDDFYNKAYKDTNVGTYQDLYKLGYENEWKGNSAGYNSLGILNAQTLGMFNIFGSTKRTSGDWVGNGDNWKTDNLYSAITDYRRLLGRKGDYTDELLAGVTEAFKGKGYEFIEDNNGYYKLRPIETSSSQILEEQVISEPESNPKTRSVPTSGEESYIHPGTDKKRTSEQSLPFEQLSFRLKFYNALPNIIGAGRLISSVVTNNKVNETIKKSLRPVLEDTYERFSPVTGAFSEMLLRNRQATGVRRAASTPFTSDASLLLAGLLDANRLAVDLEYQGFLADDKEIKRTANEALLRLEDNLARRSAVANKNRLSINTANREVALLEATRLKQNWLSIDNFLLGVEERMRTRSDMNKQRLAQALGNWINWDYLDAVRKADLDFAKRNSEGTDQDKLNDEIYLESIRKALRKRDMALNSIFYAKHGGSFKPSTIYLINKVIKNESNT